MRQHDEDFNLDDYFNLGNILRRRGVIAEKQLHKALKLQEHVGGRLGEHLVALGYCTARDVGEALKMQEQQREKPAGSNEAAFAKLEAAVGSLEKSAASLAQLGRRGVSILRISDDKSGAMPLSPPNGVLSSGRG